MSAFPGAPCPSPSCSVCTSPSSPPAMGTGPAAPTGPSTGLPTAAALGQPPPGPAMPAARAGRGPAGSLGPVEQQYATRHARTEGAVSGQAAVTALQGGGATPARQMWMNAVLEGAAVPSTVSTPQAVTGVTVRRGTAHLWTGHSACPGEGPPGWPQTPQQVNSLLVCTPSAEPGGMGREVGWQMRWGLPYLGSSPENWGVEVCRRDRGEGLSSA